MIALVLATLFSGGFGIVMRYAQRARCSMPAVATVNYLFAAAVSLLTAVLGGARTAHPTSLALGAAGGVAFAVTFYLLSTLMRRRGVTIGSAVIRLAAVIPVVASVVVWRQTASPLEVTGGLVALASLPLLSVAPGQGRAATRLRDVPLILAVFLGQGGCLLPTLAFSQAGLTGQGGVFLAALFTTAAAISAVAWAVRGRAAVPSGPPLVPAGAPVTLIWGLALGLCNALGNRFLVIALSRVPGMLVYPFHAAVGILLTVLFSRLVWSERIGRPAAAGILLACGAVVLMNLG